jgi:hypothetical protein
LKKEFAVRTTFTDRKEGPGTGRTIRVVATSLPGAAGRGVREFYRGLTRKQRIDVRTSGLEVRITEVKNGGDLFSPSEKHALRRSRLEEGDYVG